MLCPLTQPKEKTTNFKTKNNQNCQKIELCGSPTTKELKKKHSSRLGEGIETGSGGREDTRQGSDWQTSMAKLGETTGE